MTTSHSISPHISSTLSSITPSPSPHVFLSGAQSESTPENDLFEKYLLIDTDPETQREREMPAWLVPGLQPLPKRMQDVLENTVTPGATEELHLGQFAGEEGTPVSLQQPPQPKQGTTEALTWECTLELLRRYDHEVYFDALIAAAHPPPLYADHHADASIVGEGWHPRVAAAFKSLMFDAGIRPEVLMNNVAHIFPDGPVRILALKMLAQIGSVKCSVPDTVTTPKQPLMMLKTYAQVFQTEYEQFMEKTSDAAAQLFQSEYGQFKKKTSDAAGEEKTSETTQPMELSYLRDFTEYVRIKGFLEPVMKKTAPFTKTKGDLDTPPFLYALPFVQQLRPAKLLELLHSYLIMRTRLPEDSEFKKWVNEKQTPHKISPKKFSSNNQRVFKAANAGLPVMIKTHGLSEAWQAKPFESDKLQRFITEGMKSAMHAILTLVTLSHTFLYLRRLNARDSPHTLDSLLKPIDTFTSAGVSPQNLKDLTAHANIIATASIAIMCERSIRDCNVEFHRAKQVLGGQFSKFTFFTDRFEAAGGGVSTQPEDDDTERGPSSSKVPKVK